MDAVELQGITVACKLLGKSLLEKLREIESSRRMEFEQAHTAYIQLRSESIAIATAQIDATLVNEKAEVDALQVHVFDVKRAIENERIAESTKKGLRINDRICPIGTKLKRVENKGKYNQKVQFGVVEVRTRETVLPENIASYKEPSIGKCFIRICNKDGKPGRRIAEWVNQWEIAE